MLVALAREDFWEMDDDKLVKSLFGKKRGEEETRRDNSTHSPWTRALNYDHFIRAAELVNVILSTNDDWST